MTKSDDFTPTPQSIGANIKAIRLSKGLSQSVVASRLGIHQTAYSRAESGERALTIKLAIALAELFGVSLDVLLAREASSDISAKFSLLSEQDQKEIMCLIDLKLEK